VSVVKIEAELKLAEDVSSNAYSSLEC